VAEDLAGCDVTSRLEELRAERIRESSLLVPLGHQGEELFDDLIVGFLPS